MSDTPIIDAAAEAIDAVHNWEHASPRQDAILALRAANPWEPSAEEIEAMRNAIDPSMYAATRRTALNRKALAAYRACPIMRELYDSDGAPR